MEHNEKVIRESRSPSKNHSKSKSIRNRLTGIIVLVSLVSLILGGLVLMLEDVSQFKDEFSNKMVLITKTVGSYAAADIAFNDHKAANDSLSRLKEIDSVINAHLYASDGSLFASLRDESSEKLHHDQTNNLTINFENKNLFITSTIKINEEVYGFIQLVASTSEMGEKINQRLLLLLILAAFLTGVSYLLARSLSYRVTRPILDLAETTGLITEKGNYDLRVETKSDDEIGILYNSFNNMLNKIAEEKLITADVVTKLSDSEARFSAMFNAIPDAIMFADQNRQIRLNNPAVFKLFQYNNEELIGNTTEMLYPSREAFLEQGKIRFNKDSRGMDIPYEVQYKRKNGEIFWTESLGAKVVAADNTHIGFIGIFRDITERKQQEEKLLLQKNEQKQILDTMVDAAITIDEHGNIISFNNSAERIFQYPIEEVVGRNVNMLMSENIANQHDNFISNYQQTGGTKVIGIGRELTARRKSGKEFPIRLSVAELPKVTGGSRRYIGTIQDITLEKEQEEILQRSQKMDALGKLTGGIAHDFNNMLGIILGYSQLLEDMLVGNSKALAYTQEILNASGRARELTTKLLAFSRKRPINAKLVNINHLINNSKLMLEKSLTARIELRLNLENELWSTYLDDAGFVDILLNLSINAMHAMPEGGVLTIRTENVRLTPEDANALNLEQQDNIIFSVADTGSGMTTEVQQSVFEPFFTTKGEMGTGLGLAQVYGYVTQAKGSIKFYSKPNQGTQFFIYFPRNDSAAKQESVAQEKISDSLYGTETVLLVDDEIALLNFGKEVLTANGYTTLIAGSGSEALEILKENTVDILLSDVIMPEMDGYLLAEKVQQLYPSVKLQLTSGFNIVSQHSTLSKHLQKNILHKPYGVTDLLKCVKNLSKQTSETRPGKNLLVLVLDDDKDVQILMKRNLGILGHETILAEEGRQAFECYSDAMKKGKAIDVAIIDINIKGTLTGIDVARKILAIDPNANLIVSSGDTQELEIKNYSEHGFKAALEKTFSKVDLDRVLHETIRND